MFTSRGCVRKSKTIPKTLNTSSPSTAKAIASPGRGPEIPPLEHSFSSGVYSFAGKENPMLENSLFESQGRKKTRKPVTVVVSAGAHIVTIVVLVLIPLLQTQAITVPPIDMSLFLPRIEPRRYVEVVSAPPRIQNN